MGGGVASPDQKQALVGKYLEEGVLFPVGSWPPHGSQGGEGPRGRPGAVD